MSSPSASLSSSPVFVTAYAKINLTLAVLGKRADGYHQLASVMQTISLHDTLRLAPILESSASIAPAMHEQASSEEATADALPLLFACDAPALGIATRNLAYRAARLLSLIHI